MPPDPDPLDVLPAVPPLLEERPPEPLLVDGPPHDAALLDIELPEELPAFAPPEPLEPPAVPSLPPSPPPPPPMTEPPAPLHATKPDKVMARTTSDALDMEDPPTKSCRSILHMQRQIGTPTDGGTGQSDDQLATGVPDSVQGAGALGCPEK
jgi:hypothetical protein